MKLNGSGKRPIFPFPKSNSSSLFGVTGPVRGGLGSPTPLTMGCAQWVRGGSHVMRCREITVIDPQDQPAPLPKGGCQRRAGMHAPQQ